jgi:hypothetical protein
VSFRVGNIEIEFKGNAFFCKKLANILELGCSKSRKPDVYFEFCDSLPPIKTESFVALDDHIITDSKLRITEKLFDFEIDLAEKPYRVLIANKRASYLRRTQKTIRKNWRYFYTHGRGGYLHYLKRFIFYIYMPILEYSLLEKNATLSHCSGIEKNGRVVIFPAWGGVGKTGLMSMYLNEGWKFLSDDSCVVCQDGQVHIHPLPMHIYKYHEIQNGDLVKKMLAQSSLFNIFLWKIFGLITKPDRLVRWARPVDVWGKEKIALNGKISAVIHLYRYFGLEKIQLKEVSANEISSLMTSTILDEVNNLANMSIVVNSYKTFPLIPNISALFDKIQSIYQKAFTNARCYLISMPETATSRDVYEFINRQQLIL